MYSSSVRFTYEAPHKWIGTTIIEVDDIQKISCLQLVKYAQVMNQLERSEK